MVCSLLLDIQNDMNSADGMQSADADHAVNEAIPTTPEGII
jgi:hypothetical protein